uniref:Uncharacterized protein n=1 Tax=Tetraselmis sp. GSL018 TaxID=582737 RepID=A0A061SIJ4_9CHLO
MFDFSITNSQTGHPKFSMCFKDTGQRLAGDGTS